MIIYHTDSNITQNKKRTPMPEQLTPDSNPTKSPVEQSAALYDEETRATKRLERAEDNFTIATQGYGSELVSDESEAGFDEELGEDEAGRQYEAAIDARAAAIVRSNDFAQQHMDELHEAAVKEAAERVADVYAEVESPNRPK